ncbi:membrane protein insertion efficiency factor YidD [Candidatus Uhrbacteria bacterium CG22_combo_CG10-13_8_21_14_all_47_17]|uniref:Putative membrane protein insertion efficiency factor n=1 Tax=Candidatus Uhrbacteria bacterium CG22_combo_CG10-13_8_21_14_all_47_17 TaxID=1975041 RepID=A0A2H0BT40_9BACT|nr:MAG: membrane protein insertion efficiency factor YidD [Candidatus Uhrbacteria bacterium CG22_combo_CG10-13_8_21_14_all_47_17]
MKRVLSIPKTIVKKFIRVYQKTLSFDHGPLQLMAPHGACKFHPTCSEYGYQAIDRYGVLKGGLLAVKRVSRCHPWSMGGHDPVPEK